MDADKLAAIVFVVLVVVVVLMQFDKYKSCVKSTDGDTDYCDHTTLYHDRYDP